MEPVYIFVLVIDFTKKWGFRRENNHFLLSCWTFLTRKWVFFLKNEYFEVWNDQKTKITSNGIFFVILVETD